MFRVIALSFLAIAISGCAPTRSSSNIELSNESAEIYAPTLAENIIVTEDDILDRSYETLGDIEVSVSKTTLLNEDPTNDMVDEKLREEAAELGADAVILVRYGTVGISMFSWGKLDGRGRAIKFVD